MSGFPSQSCPGEDSYGYLQGLNRADLAWEWLRRDVDYRRLSPSHKRQANLGVCIDIAPTACIARWGCLYIENPKLRAAEVSMLWTSTLDPRVLPVAASPCSCHDAAVFDLRQWADRAMIIIGDTGRKHILLQGDPHIRLDVIAGTLHDGPVSLLFDMAGSDKIERSIRALRYFLRSCRNGASSLSAPKRPSLRRAINALRVHDALQQGASIRDIAIMLFGMSRIEAEWHAPGEALKSCCRRLIAHSRSMARGGYKKLLR